MRDSDKARFAAGIERLCRVFGSKADSADLAGDYWQALRRMDVGVFEAVVLLAVEKQHHMPKPAALWALAKDVRHERQADARRATETADQAAVDPWVGAANRILFAWLWGRVKAGNVLDPATLTKVTQSTRAIGTQFAQLAADRDPEATGARLADIVTAEAERLAPA